jgi:hypothetical protein
VVPVIQCVRKVAVHLGYGTYIWLSVSKLPLKCALFSLYSVVKQRLKCNTDQACDCLIQFLVGMVRGHTPNTFYKCTATFRTHCSLRCLLLSPVMRLTQEWLNRPRDVGRPQSVLFLVGALPNGSEDCDTPTSLEVNTGRKRKQVTPKRW